jgi:hypothetical protein
MPIPASRARIPNEAPNANTAIAIGAVARAPAANEEGTCRRTPMSVIMELASMMME